MNDQCRHCCSKRVPILGTPVCLECYWLLKDRKRKIGALVVYTKDVYNEKV